MPVNTQKYLHCKYKDGARGPAAFDCWGLVRHVLHVEFEKPLFASFGHVRPDQKRAMTSISRSMLDAFTPEAFAKEGAVILAYHASILRHVGIYIQCDTRLLILHACMSGIYLDTRRNFEMRAGGNRFELVSVK